MRQLLTPVSILSEKHLMNTERFGRSERLLRITEHSFANKKDKNGESESDFSLFLKKNEIKHILARVKHPQTNGKVEKWYHTYEKNRKLFDDFDKFLSWYNSIRYHESLDEKHYLQTSEDAFWAKMPDGCKLNQFFSRMERDLNATN